MDRNKIASELISVARDIRAFDDYDRAHDMLMNYDRVMGYLHRRLDDFEDEMSAAARTEAGMIKAGGGKTEAITLLKKPLKEAIEFRKVLDGVIRAMEDVL